MRVELRDNQIQTQESCFEVRATCSTSSLSPREEFSLSTQRNSTKDTFSNTLHKRRQLANCTKQYLYTREGHNANAQSKREDYNL